MARNSSTPPPKLALFDRLLQGDSIETDRNVDRAMRELRESVRRDLEILFNTRPRHLPFDPMLSELQTSILSFGLPELQNQHFATAAQQLQFQKQIEDVIRRFEPRFTDFSVELTSAQSPLDRSLRFRIIAILETDTNSQSVVYDTIVDPVTGGFVIKDI